MLMTVQDMIAWGLLVLPLIVIAWACVWHVEVVAERNRHDRYLRFYQIMQQLGREETSWAEKMTAAYELRQYKDYREVIGQIFDDGQLRKDDIEALQTQLKRLVKSKPE